MEIRRNELKVWYQWENSGKIKARPLKIHETVGVCCIRKTSTNRNLILYWFVWSFILFCFVFAFFVSFFKHLFMQHQKCAVIVLWVWSLSAAAAGRGEQSCCQRDLGLFLSSNSSHLVRIKRVKCHDLVKSKNMFYTLGHMKSGWKWQPPFMVYVRVVFWHVGK